MCIFFLVNGTCIGDQENIRGYGGKTELCNNPDLRTQSLGRVSIRFRAAADGFANRNFAVF